MIEQREATQPSKLPLSEAHRILDSLELELPDVNSTVRIRLDYTFLSLFLDDLEQGKFEERVMPLCPSAPAEIQERVELLSTEWSEKDRNILRRIEDELNNIVVVRDEYAEGEVSLAALGIIRKVYEGYADSDPILHIEAPSTIIPTYYACQETLNDAIDELNYVFRGLTQEQVLLASENFIPRKISLSVATLVEESRKTINSEIESEVFVKLIDALVGEFAELIRHPEQLNAAIVWLHGQIEQSGLAQKYLVTPLAEGLGRIDEASCVPEASSSVTICQGFKFAKSGFMFQETSADCPEADYTHLRVHHTAVIGTDGRLRPLDYQQTFERVLLYEIATGYLEELLHVKQQELAMSGGGLVYDEQTSGEYRMPIACKIASELYTLYLKSITYEKREAVLSKDDHCEGDVLGSMVELFCEHGISMEYLSCPLFAFHIADRVDFVQWMIAEGVVPTQIVPKNFISELAPQARADKDFCPENPYDVYPADFLK